MKKKLCFFILLICILCLCGCKSDKEKLDEATVKLNSLSSNMIDKIKSIENNKYIFI